MAVNAWRVIFAASYVKWMLIVAGILGFAAGWMKRTNGVTYWPFATADIVFSSQLLISLTCLGFAAWQGRTDRQAAITELADTFPTSRAYQLVISWSSIAAWGIIAYLVTTLMSLMAVAPDAYWGYPDWHVLIQGATVVIGASAAGYALGYALPTYILIPVWVVSWFVLDGVLSLRDSAIMWAAPRSVYQNVDRSLFRESVPPLLELKQAVWFVALSAFMISLCLLSIDRSRRIVASVGVVLLLLASTSVLLFNTPADVAYGSGQPRSFQPVCRSNDIVTVCLHPAEEPLLEKTVILLTQTLELVAGLPGVPEKFVDSAVRQDNRSQGSIYMYTEDGLKRNVAEALVYALFPSASGPGGIKLTKEQATVATWLYSQAGFPYASAPYWMFTPEAMTGSRNQVVTDIVTKAKGFGRLPVEQRRRWLEQHWSALQTGTLNPVELP